MSDVNEDALLSDAEGEEEIQEAVGEDEKVYGKALGQLHNRSHTI